MQCLRKKLDGKYTRMVDGVLKKILEVSSHKTLPPISLTTQVQKKDMLEK